MKRRLVRATVGSMFALALVATAQAETISVPAEQNTIQAAINAASDGDTVSVSPGTYVENIDFDGKAIQVVSTQGPSVTTIDGSQAGPTVAFVSGESSTSVLSGFTITNGYAYFDSSSPYDDGGGIVIEASSPTISGNVITGNGACNGGGGIYVGFAAPLIRNNVISHNTQSGCSGGVGGGGIELGGAGAAQVIGNQIMNNSWTSGDGGGIVMDAAGTPLIENNLIEGNTATGVSPAAVGGGIAMYNDSDPVIVQNLIINNTADLGAGVSMLVPFDSIGPVIVNNTIANNSATQSASAVYATGFDDNSEFYNNLMIAGGVTNAVTCDTTYSLTAPIFQNNDGYSANVAAFAGSCSGIAGSSGNISADPLFNNPSGGDYTLQYASSVIDAGLNSAPDLPSTDFAGQPRIVAGHLGDAPIIDMGAYELQGGVHAVPSSLSFSTQPETSQTSMVVTLYNVTDTAVTIQSVTTSGDYSQTNNCPESLPGMSNCQINVTFVPTAVGERDGNLTITDSDSSSPQIIPLTGNGSAAAGCANLNLSYNFSSEPLPASSTVKAGYAFEVSRKHPDELVTLTGAAVSLNVSCADGSVKPMSVSLPVQAYDLAAKDRKWTPPGSAGASAVFQGSAESICGTLTGTTQKLATMTGQFCSTDLTDQVKIRFHVLYPKRRSAKWSKKFKVVP
jgi:Right handed beta helix region/Cep192 domain 4